MRSKKNGDGKAGSNSGETTFITYRLNDADKEWLEKSDLVSAFPIHRLIDLAQEGYKVSISPGRESKSAIVSLTDVEPSSPFYRHTLSGFGTNVIDAWYSLAYRHLVLSKGDWSCFGDTSKTDVSRFG